MKSSSIALACVLKKPMAMKEAYQSKTASQPSSANEVVSKLSIFNKPRIASQSSFPVLRSETLVYNGIGGTSKVLQSDLKPPSSTNFWTSKTSTAIKKKKLSPSVLGK